MSDVEEVITDSFNRVRGRVAGLIESWGLDPTQERAAIQIFKSLTYDSQREISEAIEEAR